MYYNLPLSLLLLLLHDVTRNKAVIVDGLSAVKCFLVLVDFFVCVCVCVCLCLCVCVSLINYVVCVFSEIVFLCV